MDRRGKNSRARHSKETEFETEKVEYTDPKTGKHFTLETKVGWIEAPEGYFIGKEPFENATAAYDYAREYGDGRSRVMRQLVGNGLYYCYMHFFKFEDAAEYHRFLNVEKWSQKQIAAQNENDAMLGVCSLNELMDEGKDYASENDPTASAGITSAMKSEIKDRLKKRKKNLDVYDQLHEEEGLNAREISEKCGENEWKIRDDLKRIKEVKLKYWTEE